jgi:hypothetical protein
MMHGRVIKKPKTSVLLVASHTRRKESIKALDSYENVGR